MPELQKADVVIIGAGVLGVSLAYHLTRGGQRVIVLEREASYARHASGKNAGMVRQLYHNAQLTDWAYRSIREWPKNVSERSFRETGSTIVDRYVPEHHDGLFDQRSVLCGSDELPAVYSASDGLLDSSGYVSHLYQLISKSQAEFRFNCTVAALEQTTHAWRITNIAGEKFEAPWVVNAAGAWINRFLQNKSSSLAVAAKAYARHLFVVTGWKGDFMPQQDSGFYWDEHLGWYMRRWDTTSRLVSICDQVPSNPDSFVTKSNITEEVAEKLLRALPQIAGDLQLARSWHCFRTYTDDQLPIWGEDPTAPGLFWLAAFGGFGMSTSFAAAADAARYICGKNVSVTKEFLPSRVRDKSTRRRAA